MMNQTKSMLQPAVAVRIAITWTTKLDRLSQAKSIRKAAEFAKISWQANASVH
jgi:hypothetical protein